MSIESKNKLWKMISLEKQMPVLVPEVFTQSVYSQSSFSHETVKQEPENPDHPSQPQSSAKFYIPSSNQDATDCLDIDLFCELKSRKKSSEKLFTVFSDKKEDSLRMSQKGFEAMIERNVTPQVKSIVSFGEHLQYHDFGINNNKILGVVRVLRQFLSQVKAEINQFKEQLALFICNNQFLKMLAVISQANQRMGRQIQRLSTVLHQKQKQLTEKNKEIVREKGLGQNYLKLLNDQWEKNLKLQDKILEMEDLKHNIVKKQSQPLNKRFEPLNIFASHKIKEPQPSHQNEFYYSSQHSTLKDKKYQQENNYLSNQSSLSSPFMKSLRVNHINSRSKSPRQIHNHSVMGMNSEQVYHNQLKVGRRPRKYSEHTSMGSHLKSQPHSPQINQLKEKEAKFTNMGIRLQQINHQIKQQIARFSQGSLSTN